MEVSIGSRIKHAWNAFLNRDPTGFYRDIGVGYSYRPDRPRLTRGNERSIVTSVYNRIALDCASISIQHVRLDDSERFLEKIPSGLNDCLNLSANIDQTGRAFLQDVVLSMLDEGCVAIIPLIRMMILILQAHIKSNQCVPERFWNGFQAILKREFIMSGLD